MKSDQYPEMERLIRLIQTEKDHQKFLQLTKELNELLSGDAERVPPRDPPPKTSGDRG